MGGRVVWPPRQSAFGFGTSQVGTSPSARTRRFRSGFCVNMNQLQQVRFLFSYRTIATHPLRTRIPVECPQGSEQGEKDVCAHVCEHQGLHPGHFPLSKTWLVCLAHVGTDPSLNLWCYSRGFLEPRPFVLYRGGARDVGPPLSWGSGETEPL